MNETVEQIKEFTVSTHSGDFQAMLPVIEMRNYVRQGCMHHAIQWNDLTVVQ